MTPTPRDRETNTGGRPRCAAIPILLALTAIGCGSDEGHTDASLDGTWRSKGYGLAARFDQGAYTLYQITHDRCYREAEGTVDNTLEDPEIGVPVDVDGTAATRRFMLELAGDELVVRDTSTYRVGYERAELPEDCASAEGFADDDPEVNFESLWWVFAEQYAFFEPQGVDWQAIYDVSRPMVTPSTTPDELFAIAGAALGEFSDYHVSLSNGVDSISRPPPLDIITNIAAIQSHVETTYLAAADVTRTGNDLIAFRRLPDGVGHVVILSMFGFGDLAAHDPVRTELTGAGAAIDEVIAALADAPAIIVDVRFNSGGLDGVALEIAGRFADQERVAFRKHARDGDGSTESREFVVRPAGPQQYLGEVRVLTSAITVSAAEVFVMAMRELPHVVVMGDTTAGSHSDILERTMPNGWVVGLSNEVYTAADGRIYERIGIPPGMPIALDAPGFAEGRDAILEAALAAIEG